MTLSKFWISYSLWLSIIGSIVFVEVQATIYFHSRKPTVAWTPAPDNWDFEKAPRSTTPFLQVKHFSNRTGPTESDADYLEQQRLQKERNSRPHGYDFHPKFLGRLVSWNELTYDLENVVIPCTACKAGIGLLLHYIKTGRTEKRIKELITEYCNKLKIQSPPVCEGISENVGADVIYTFRRVTTDPDEACSFLLGEACGDRYDELHQWQVELPQVPKPPAPTELPVPKEGAPFFKVLHISDYHYDPYYEEGSNADCDLPLCCRASSGKSANIDAAAGKWGDYRKCDAPKRLLDNALSHIAETHKDLDYIIWTGDLPPHDVWNQTKSSNLDIIKESIRQMTEHFPGVPIFPAIGNHESAPVNSYPPPYIDDPEFSINWLYDELDILWKRWLPESTSETIRRGAFYSVLLRPGFRIISLNSNYGNNKNWWLLFNSTDPASELQWFINELQLAERMNEKVHIIGHIPPGYTEVLKVWSRNFYDIVARFEDTIVAQFYGHTHFDEFEVFYDPRNWTHPTSIAYIGPSLSPYEDLNPGYRIYYVDGDHDATTRLVIDHETWIMDLGEANAQQVDDPNWYKLYSAREAYGMEALRPSDWHKFITEMSNNRDLFNEYYKHYWSDSPVRPPCEEPCRKRLICDSKSGRSNDRKQFCQELEPKSLLLRGIKTGVSAVESTIRFVKDIF